MAITYQLGGKLYINLTNRCPNQCKFCVRQFKEGIGGYNLWLDEEPSPEEVIKNIGEANQYSEIVFCGYGEPLVRLKAVIKIASYLQENYPQVVVRINTNGLADLIHEREVLPLLVNKIDAISISLNASDADTYQKISQPKFGEEAFSALLKFIKQAKKLIPEVTVSVVNRPEINISACRKLANKLGVKFRVRG